LLYLVSNSFEKSGRGTPIIGMEKFADEIDTHYGKPNIYYSNGRTGSITRSSSHGEFDNDPYTMNSVLKKIRKGSVKHPFTNQDLDY
jgi:hypothetical protein